MKIIRKFNKRNSDILKTEFGLIFSIIFYIILQMVLG